MDKIKIVNISNMKNYEVKDLIDLAGFSIIIGNRCVILKDKNNDEANDTSELTFKTLYEAVKAIETYISNQYKFVF